jgi:branched-chain amino acid transport system permease protein
MFFQQLINGLALGCTYALLALGYTLVFGVLGILNIAHGEVFMFGALIAANFILFAHANFFFALLASMIGAMFVGILVERLTIRPLRREGRALPLLPPLITTLGAIWVLQEVAIKIFGAEVQPFPPVFQEKNFTLGTVRISSSQLIIIGVSLFLMFSLFLTVAKSKWGKGMRAVAENAKMAALLGINVNGVMFVTFAVASALAGVAGFLVGISYYSYSPFMGVQIGLKGFAVIVIGGMGNIWGAMVGGLILGMVEILSVGYLASSFRDAIAFGLMILILLVKPTGIFGSRTVA